jgi:hypothetical protein
LKLERQGRGGQVKEFRKVLRQLPQLLHT